MANELHVVSMAEFLQRSEELTREVNETRKPLFIMDGDTMVARLLAPERTLDQIYSGLRVMDRIDQVATEMQGKWVDDREDDR